MLQGIFCKDTNTMCNRNQLITCIPAEVRLHFGTGWCPHLDDLSIIVITSSPCPQPTNFECTATSCNIQASSCGDIGVIYTATTATHCYALQRTATHCNALQRTATHYNTLHHTATHRQDANKGHADIGFTYTLTRCNAPQHAATHCTTLQHTGKTPVEDIVISGPEMHKRWENGDRANVYNFPRSHCLCFYLLLSLSLPLTLLPPPFLPPCLSPFSPCLSHSRAHALVL